MTTLTSRPVRQPASRRAPGTAPLARPALAPRPGRLRGGVSSCRVAPPQPVVVAGQWGLRLKLVAVATLTLLGSAVAVGSFVEQAQPDPLTEYVAGDPGWSHVNP